jgi:hypothetical protein
MTELAGNLHRLGPRLSAHLRDGEIPAV